MIGREEEATHPSPSQLSLDPVGVAQRRLQAALEVGHRTSVAYRYESARARPAAVIVIRPFVWPGRQ